MSLRTRKNNCQQCVFIKSYTLHTAKRQKILFQSKRFYFQLNCLLYDFFFQGSIDNWTIAPILLNEKMIEANGRRQREKIYVLTSNCCMKRESLMNSQNSNGVATKRNKENMLKKSMMHVLAQIQQTFGLNKLC